MKIKLNKSEYQFIAEHVVLPLSKIGVKVFVFGSRAKGTPNKYSDLDLLLRHENFTDKIKGKISEIEEFLIESNFPYKVDLVIEDNLAHSYRNEILNHMLEFQSYEK